MQKPLVTDELWELIEPVKPSESPKPKGGRPRVPDRDVLNGIVLIFNSRTAWEDLPKELGNGSGRTCRRRQMAKVADNTSK